MIGNKLWIVGATLVAIIVLVLAWFLGISPQLAEAEFAKSEQAKVDALNAVQATALVKLREQFDNLESLEADLEELRAQIPQDALVEDFLDFIETSADASGVIVGSIQPDQAGPVPVGDTASTSFAMYAIPASITVEGPSERVLEFSRLLQEGERLFLADSVNFSSGTGGRIGGTVHGYIFILRGAQVAEAPVE